MAEEKKKKIGTKAVDAAEKYLNAKGYEVLDKNWKCKIGEIGIVARYDDTLVFVEVKARTQQSVGLPEDAIGPKKKQKYENIAVLYLQEHDYVDMTVRFDVIGLLIIGTDRALIRHHVNAFGKC